MARGVSTVLDVAVCLLLVGVAITTLLVGIPTESRNEPPDEDTTARSLGTVTASIPVGAERQSHGTLAEHLTRAAIVNGSIEGTNLLPSSYPESVQKEVRSQTEERTHITVRWRPYRDAPLNGRLAFGPVPPTSAEVSATRVTIDSGMSNPDTTDSFEALAASYASAYVSYLFPETRTRSSLLDSRTAEEKTTRYRHASEVLGTDIEDEITDAHTGKANERLAGTLADQLASDLESRYDSPTAAAEHSTIDEVDIVVRRWEP